MSAEPAVAFGGGRDEPYRRVLDGPAPGRLTLHAVDGSHHSMRLDAGAWVRPATAADLTALQGASGPMLDVGCGPGRMVRAAAARSIPALGIDVAAHAVARTRADGTPALRRSVFHPLPLEGRWQTILLMDGNIGIGGDPEALLHRCRALLDRSGSLVIEVDSDPNLSVRSRYTAVDDEGRESEPFPWARVGWVAIIEFARRAGLAVVQHWQVSGRHFVRAVQGPVGEPAPAASVPADADVRRAPRRSPIATVASTASQTTASESA